mmetsp:Transcript_6107/g.17489  ORF Transcript_6107/g.17489 Transcript_6107/m.17489 type:complete len:299 (+) Transcript_6107:190-1086(+)|eukprot:CAMPEP_0206144412 /NCGR_PEP_ID=MMETSP1473-20131121/24045_1 /ASSEMBLY_ACC=CAM_ASM_001109 /TAXON_ID=1461547 /ORGANISM="Stichococcus sp, Strain RCC1054" /LENGTH=298 /DNA_ID=CAMNT_0053540231 /DNA_START=108 /DNA_END=1004 /DNA_ORIENTATION=+
MHQMTAEAEAFLKEEAQIAVEQLAALSRPDPPRFPLGQLNPKPLKAARGVFFMHTTKLGLGLGLKWGSGWLLMRTALDPPRWSAPVLYHVKEGSIGFTAGRGGSATLIALGTDAAVDAFCSGKAVLGDDMSFSLGGNDAAPAESSNAFDRSWKESVAWTVADGLLLDVSLTGGVITVDKKHNAALYGASATPTTIIVKSSSTTRKPGGFDDVYAALNAIIACADSDPRDFSSFKRDWTPTKPRDPSYMGTGSAAPGTEENPLPGGKVTVASHPPQRKSSGEEGLQLLPLSGPAHSHQA